VTATRRVVLGGGLSAALWRLGAWARAGAPAQAAQGILDFEAAPARFQVDPAPAEPAVAYAYAGAIPGPLIRLKQGNELRLKFANKLAEPTRLSFPGLRAANSAAGIGGPTQERLKPDARAEIRFLPPDSGFNLYLPHAGSTEASQQGRGLFGPIIIDEPKVPDVELDAAVVLSEWDLDASGPIRSDFADPGHRPRKRAKRRRRFREQRGRAVEAKGSTGRPRQAASRQRRDRASRDRCDKRRKDPHRGGRRPAGRTVRTSQKMSSRWVLAPGSN
jgi:Multicopper oxidase